MTAAAAVPLSYRFWPKVSVSDDCAATKEDQAKTPILVMVHGMTSAALTFSDVAKPLTTVAHVVAVDQRGHGGTPISHGPSLTSAALVEELMTVEQLAEDLEAFVTSSVFGSTGLKPADGGQPVSFEPRPVHVLGHSWGARTVCAFAARYPNRIASIIIEDELMRGTNVEPATDSDVSALIEKVERAMCGYREDFPTHAAAAEYLADALRMKSDFSGKIGEVRGSNPPVFAPWFKPHVALAWNRCASTYDASPLWRTGSAPVLLVAAGDDTSDLSLADQQALSKEAEQLSAAQDRRADAAPHRRVVVIPGSSHSIHRTHPAEFVDLVMQHIAALSSS